ncbi:hypothetical protein [Noviherbaspirillum sedimenti]|uniref:Uncharacterized protein n=1 Tax=Noviherbaspirillum sedimenti TaxID=2320865 RepID=A0A3A3GKF7_9BURK|nr:hypothetical protein [Noviherbaspirillum sedimenti]RJG01440.1 hypothetical protein D3878_07445 [Noviherbaspirillum sedimenti]
MTSDEIVSEISRKNRDAFPMLDECEYLSRDQVLDLMDAAAMRGFQFGSNVALSMVQGALLVQLARAPDLQEKPRH